MKKLIFSVLALFLLFFISPNVLAKVIPDEIMIHSKDVRRENGDTPFYATSTNSIFMKQTIPSINECYYFYLKIYASYGKTVYDTEYNIPNNPFIYVSVFLTRGANNDLIKKKLFLKDVNNDKDNDYIDSLYLTYYPNNPKPAKFDSLHCYLDSMEKLLPYNTIRVEISTDFTEGACALYYYWEIY